MKVLYINAMGPTEKTPFGGIFVSHRISALRKLGVDVIPVSIGIMFSPITKAILRIKNIKDNGKLIDTQLDVKYKTLDVKMNLFDTFKTRSDNYSYKKVLERDLYDELNQYCDVELIHLHWCWPVGLFISKFAKEKNIPYVCTFHGSDINIQLQSPVIRPDLLNIMEDAASVEFISKALLKTALNAGYSGKNAVIINNGIDTNIFFRSRKKNKNIRVGFVGNLIPIKGADRLPAILSKINERFANKIEFIVVGQGVLLEELKTAMNNLPVTFTGQLSPAELAVIYNSLDLLIIPSRNEGYPCVIKEAQACGVIVLGNDVGGICEAIGDYGSVISSEDEEQLSELLAERAIDYLENRLSIDIDKMVCDAQKCSWVDMQKYSLDNYESILAANKKVMKE